MMIPLPFLMWFATATGQPVVVFIAPGAAPVYSQPAAKLQSNSQSNDTVSSGCRYLICKA